MRAWWLALAAVCIALPGCRPATDAQPVTTQAPDGQPIDWRTFDLVGKKLELIDERRLEEYDFTSEGLAPASIGIKNEAAFGPLYAWRVVNHTLLLSEDADAAPFESYELLSTNGDIVNTRNKAGAIKRFKLSTFKAAAAPAP